MAPQTPNDPFYMSAPASPGRISLEVQGLCTFFSAPTSPTRTNLESAAYEDSSSHSQEFEFEISRLRFDVGECEVGAEQEADQYKMESSLPAMAFADELFSQGKVMPLKRPPPRLQFPNYNKLDRQSSTSFQRRSFVYSLGSGETGESAKESGITCTKESKSQKIMNFYSGVDPWGN